MYGVLYTYAACSSSSLSLLDSDVCTLCDVGFSGGTGSGRSAGAAAGSGLCHARPPALHPSSSSGPAGQSQSSPVCVWRITAIVFVRHGVFLFGCKGAYMCQSNLITVTVCIMARIILEQGVADALGRLPYCFLLCQARAHMQPSTSVCGLCVHAALFFVVKLLLQRRPDVCGELKAYLFVIIINCLAMMNFCGKQSVMPAQAVAAGLDAGLLPCAGSLSL